jgi:acylphosphatase
MAARAHLVVTGRVQGVWFRGSMQEEARRLGVSGWVRNLRDGSVESEAEGERGAVEALAAWAHSGPPGARVDAVTVDWIAPQGESGGFVVRRG